MNTTLLKIDYGKSGAGEDLGVKIPETPIDYTPEEAVSDIISGAHFGTLRGVYIVGDGMCKDVSSIVADRIVDAIIRGDFVSPMARDFANYFSKKMPKEDAR